MTGLYSQDGKPGLGLRFSCFNFLCVSQAILSDIFELDHACIGQHRSNVHHENNSTLEPEG